MTEQVYSFGPDEGLVGVWTEPDGPRRRSDAPTILCLNSGVLHSVGPFGWYVTLARRFADQGIASFRFDISGVGDSPPRADNLSNTETGVADITAAMDFLARERGARRFVLLGLCSGAILAQRLASQDDRVTGAVLIDGWGYRTKGFYFRHFSRRVVRWQSWVSGIRRLLRKITAKKTEKASTDVELLVRHFHIEFPRREIARRQLSDARNRGARLLIVYTGDVDRYYNHPRQFEEMFMPLKTGDPFEVDYMSAADHLFSDREARLALFSRIENWFERVFHEPHRVGLG